jgi:histone acetyltransferase (RNA polymerase elongator complex component)
LNYCTELIQNLKIDKEEFPLIIPIFIMNRGCPNRCIFCNISKISGGHSDRITKATFRETVERYLNNEKRKAGRIQIAFYGGNFTGMHEDDQITLLEYARPFVKKGMVNSIRISTRPDYIDADSLDMLKRFSVDTIEIGAQSMEDNVLRLAKRGHSSADVMNGVSLAKSRGFETGVHLMAGLPGDNASSFDKTVEKTIALQPDMVRIHPTLVFSDTEIERLYRIGEYTPMSMQEAIDTCKNALRKFADACIPVIRLGLQTTQDMEAPGNVVAGPYHPAFRSLVEQSLYYDMASSLLLGERVKNKTVSFILSPKSFSGFRGQKNINLRKLRERFELAEIYLVPDPNQPKLSLNMAIG